MTATATIDLREAAQEEYPELRDGIDPALKEAGVPKIVSLVSSPETKVVRVPAFRVNGVTYSIAVKPRVNAGLEYVHLARTRGSEIAIDYMLETLLGKDGYQALREFDDLTEEDLKAVVDAASRIMAGPLEGPKGKRPNASRKSRG